MTRARCRWCDVEIEHGADGRSWWHTPTGQATGYTLCIDVDDDEILHQAEPPAD